MAEPLPVIPLQYATGEARGRRFSGVFVACAVFGWLACVATCPLIQFITVESVLIAGPVIFAAGLAALVGGIYHRAPWLAVTGACHCAVCTLLLALVNLLGWGPGEAAKPFLYMGSAYCLLSLPLVILVIRWHRSRRGL